MSLLRESGVREGFEGSQDSTLPRWASGSSRNSAALEHPYHGEWLSAARYSGRREALRQGSRSSRYSNIATPRLAGTVVPCPKTSNTIVINAMPNGPLAN